MPGWAWLLVGIGWTLLAIALLLSWLLKDEEIY